MIAADCRGPRPARLLAADAQGAMRHLPRAGLASLFRPGDLVVANDAATLPASLHGVHCPSGEQIEIRLAGWISAGDPTRFLAVAFGAGDWRTRTEDRPPPPPLARGDRLALGPLSAAVLHTLGHPRLFALRFEHDRVTVLAGLARHGRPVQYAHVPQPLALWDVWTPIAAEPAAFEPPSAGFALDWHTLAAWRQHGVGFATITHAAGLSSTGDPALDRLFPFDEPYRIPHSTVVAIVAARATARRVIAIGTTVVRALECAANTDGRVQGGEGVARGRIGLRTRLRVVDAIVTGVHEPGTSHFELLRAFAGDALLDSMSAGLGEQAYLAHEFGDSVLIERQWHADRLRAKLPAA
jgi:S-adenosylmethionine:tRNA ribosyltransferase-isomerase